MKMKKFLCAALSSALVITALAGCGGGGTDSGSADAGSSANAGGDVYTVGISQFADYSRQLRFTEGKPDLRYSYSKCSCRLQRCHGH